MKRILLTIGLMIGAHSIYAQLNVNPANITEAEFHPYQTWDIFGWFDPSNSNAHSHGNLFINGSYRDLYVFTWDNAMGIAGDGGFAVWQMPVGTPVEYGTSGSAVTDFKSAFNGDFDYPYQQIRSLEAGILNDGSTTYIALTYYSSRFYLALYEWDGISLGPPTLFVLNGSSDDPPEGWIHQDVNNLNKIVITWEQDGRIFTKAGEMTATGFELGNTAQLYENTIEHHELTRPDVAMMQETSGETALYYAVETPDEAQLFVYKGDFNDLYTIPNNTPPALFSVDSLYSKKAAAGLFGLPRIDAPDNAFSSDMDNTWSCTVAEHTGNQDFIWGITRLHTGETVERILNDGSLAPTLQDITANSGNPDIFNRRPTVAFSNTGHELFFAWSFRNPVLLNPNNSTGKNATYLSVKTTLDLQILNIPANLYFQIPQSNINTDFTPSVALSTQNDASPQLFSSFIQWPNPFNYDYYIGLKTVNWNTTTGYKPSGTTDLSEINDNYTIHISPNPFRESFQLNIEDADNTSYQLTITNILGQKVYSTQGKLSEINKDLSAIGKQLHSGTYFVILQEQDKVVHRQQVVKW